MRKSRVALESAVITHGLPRPLNLEVAQECEAAVRKSGALPATIAVIAGRVRIGLTGRELARLAANESARKCAAQDIGMLVATKQSGGTTVSATLALAARARIAVMSTGGIGGVHRGTDWDVSPDLMQLSRSPVTVVCAGAKSVLDLPRTLEMLETLGVPVIGYQTGEFPGFFYRNTGLRLTHSVDSVAELFKAIAAYRRTGYNGGIVVAQPPQDAMDCAEVEGAASEALRFAASAGVTGQALTPYLLAQLAVATEGRSLDVNRKLLVANAALAGRLSLLLKS